MRKPLLLALALVASSLLGTSCSSISPERALANEWTRSEQQRQGYFDKESSAQQRKDDERSEQERLHDKK